MKKICEWCKCEFTARPRQKFCSRRCTDMAQRKRNHERREARAKALGITVEELVNLSYRNKVRINPCRTRSGPKSYREIKAANRRHPIAAGWRGTPVIGGGCVHRHDPYLRPSEYPRCTVESDAVKAVRARRSRG